MTGALLAIGAVTAGTVVAIAFLLWFWSRRR